MNQISSSDVVSYYFESCGAINSRQRAVLD